MIGDKIWSMQVVDDLGHRYVIPADMEDVWYMWLHNMTEGLNDGEPPDWAQPVDGGDVQFTEWQIR